jgi:hypothetical protein
VYEVLQLRVGKLRVDGYNGKVQTLVKGTCSTEFEADVLNTMG